MKKEKKKTKDELTHHQRSKWSKWSKLKDTKEKVSKEQ